MTPFHVRKEILRQLLWLDNPLMPDLVVIVVVVFVVAHGKVNDLIR